MFRSPRFRQSFWISVLIAAAALLASLSSGSAHHNPKDPCHNIENSPHCSPWVLPSSHDVEVEIDETTTLTAALKFQPKVNTRVRFRTTFGNAYPPRLSNGSGTPAEELTLTFTPSNWSTPQTIKLHPRTEVTVARLRTGSSFITSTILDCATVFDCKTYTFAHVTVTPDNPQSYRLWFSYSLSEEGEPFEWIVSMSRKAREPLSMKWRLKGGTASAADFSFSGGTIHFPVGVRKVKIKIPTVDDDDYEGTETAGVELYDLPDGVTAERGQGVLHDNDENPMPKIRENTVYANKALPLPPGGNISTAIFMTESPGKGNTVSLTFENPRPDLFTMYPNPVVLSGDDFESWRLGNKTKVYVQSRVGVDKGLIKVDVPVTLAYKDQTIAGTPLPVYVNHSDQPLVPVHNVGRWWVTEGDREVEFRIRLQKKPNGLFLVAPAIQQSKRMTRGGGIDFSIKPAKRTEFDRDYYAKPLIFSPSNWNQWQTVKVTFLEDLDTENERMRLFSQRLLTLLHPKNNYVAPGLTSLWVKDTGANAPVKKIGTLTSTGLTSNSVTIGWNTAGGVSGYEIRYQKSGGTQQKITLGKSVLSNLLTAQKFLYKINSLDPGSSYSVSVHAIINGKVLASLDSDVLTFTTLVVQNSPGDESSSDADQQSSVIVVSNDPPQRAQQQSEPAQQEQTQQSNQQETQTQQTQQPTQQGQQEQQPAEEEPEPEPEPEPPTRVGKATLSGLTSTAVNIGWNSAGDVAGYQIRYWETDDGEVKKRKLKLDGKVLTLSNSKFLYRLADLEAGRTYRLRVHVVLKNGKVSNKLSSGVLNFSTPEAPKAKQADPPPKAQAVKPAGTSAREPVGQPSATAKSHEEISVSWPAVQGASEYEVRYWETDDKQNTKIKLRSNTPSITLTKLKASTDYTIRAFFIKNGKVHNSKASPPLRVVTDAAP